MKNETSDARETKEIPFLFILVLCGILAAGIFALAFADAKTPPVFGLDFRAFLTAGHIILNGGPLYDLTHQFAAQKEIFPMLQKQPDLLPFFNPPFAALPLALAAWLPPVKAFALWTVFETLLLALLLRYSQRSYRTIHRACA